MQIDSMSLRRATCDLLDPLLERRPRVVRPRPRLWMELQRARVELGEAQALDRAVVERDVRRLLRPALADREAVILARDEHMSRRALEHRVVRAAVPERELERLVPRREREQLMTETDAHH